MSIIINRSVSLDGPVMPETMAAPLYQQENQGHQFAITTTYAGSIIPVTGTVQGRMIRPNGSTVVITGSVSNGRALLTLPQSAYTYPGRYILSILNVVNGAVTVIYSATGYIARSLADVQVDPGSVVPDITQLLAEIEEMRTATAAANSAASNASVNFAPAFSESSDYSAGQYATYNGRVYRFKVDHPAGGWNAEDVAITNAATEIRKAMFMVANAFSPATDYSTGQFVVYGGTLYRFIRDHAAGAWNSAHVAEATVGTNVYNNSQSIAYMFDPAHSYAVGDYAIYDYYLWRFTTAHTGAWNQSHATRVRLADDVQANNTLTTQLRNDIANAFSTSGEYQAGQFVVYNGTLYRFDAHHEPGAWDSSQVSVATAGTSIYKNNQNLALQFDPTHSYAVGDYAIYDYYLWRFTTAHTGAWNQSHVTRARLASEITAAVAAAAADTRQAMANTANLFSTASEYQVGQFVTYEGVMYRFDTYHAPGAWNSSQVSVATAGTNIYKNSQSIAYMFDPAHSYAVGDYAIYDYYLWRFTTAHTGAWNQSHAARVRLADDVQANNTLTTQLRGDIANVFSQTAEYQVGQFVIYEGVLYRFDTYHAPGAWNSSQVSVATAGTNIYKNSQMVACMFDPTHSYAVGDYAIYDYYLWRFTTAHTGAWNQNHAARVRLADDVQVNNTLTTQLRGDIANTFSPTRDYGAGAFVIYQGDLYRFDVAHPAGQWTGSDVSAATLGTNVFKNSRNMAAPFDPTQNYAVGAYVTYDYELYRFTMTHPAGQWNNAHAEQVRLGNEIAGAKSAAAADTRQAMANTANLFSTASEYQVGQFVTYEGVMYRFDTYHAPGAWNSSQVSVATAGTNIYKNSQSIAYMFDPTHSYAVGDYAIYDYYLWRFKSAHAGTWDQSHVVRVRMADEMARYAARIDYLAQMMGVSWPEE